jgi:N-acetylglutamate synthase-like GNAT family acetyltransferase
MNPPSYQTRRATLEDLNGLRLLWRAEQLATLELEKHFTQFQVAQAAEGTLAGALGLHIVGTQGRIHSEAFRDFALADTLRPLLWQRLQGVARNFGLTRLWTQEGTAFWREQGFTAAPADLLEKLPTAFVQSNGEWATLKLKDEVLSGLTQEQEFALFREAAREETEKAFRQARTLKWVAVVVAVLFAILSAVVGFYMMRYINYQKTHGGPPPNYR